MDNKGFQINSIRAMFFTFFEICRTIESLVKLLSNLDISNLCNISTCVTPVNAYQYLRV